MAAGINISLVSNVRDFLRGTRDASAGLDDVIDSLDDVARAGDDTDRSLDRDLTSIADEAERTGDKLEREMRKAFDSVRDESRRAGSDVERNTRRSFDDAGDTVGEFKDEARSNFSEIASSFTGDMDSAVDLVQGTLGGLAGSLAGPAGLAVGAIAIAAGAAYTAWNANAEKIERRVSDMYEDMLESQADYLSREFIADQLAEIYRGGEDAAISLENLEWWVNQTGAAEADVALAFAGDADARTRLLDQIIVKQRELQTELEGTTDQGDALALAEQASALANLELRMADIAEATDTAADRATAYRTALDTLDNVRGLEAWGDRYQAQADQLDALADKVNQLPTETTIAVRIDADDLAERVRAALATRVFTAQVAPQLGRVVQ